MELTREQAQRLRCLRGEPVLLDLLLDLGVPEEDVRLVGEKKLFPTVFLSGERWVLQFVE